LRELSIKLSEENLSYEILLSLTESEDFDSEGIVVCFSDISNFSSRNIGGGLTQFMHLKVLKLDSGMERLGYQLEEQEDNKLFFNFVSANIVVPLSSPSVRRDC
jgi:alanine racemase